MDIGPFIRSIRETNRQLIKLLEFLSALRHLSLVDVRYPDEQELINQALRGLVENQDLESCSVFLREGDHLVNVAGMDWWDLLGVEREPHADPRPLFMVGQGLMGQSAATGELIHCRDAASDPRFVQLPGAQKSRVGSLICLPITVGEEVRGVLNVSHPEPNAFGDAEQRMLTLFAGFLSQLLVNRDATARMEAEIHARTRALEEALAQAEALKRRYEQMAVMDELTELHNRRFFFPEAQAAVARALRSGESFSLLMIDIDLFKRVNDNFGHATGDDVLRQFAGVLRTLVREGDILARFGGEEFVVALPGTDSVGALELARRMQRAMAARNWEHSGGRLAVTASVGVSVLCRHADGSARDRLEQLIREADIALYQAKAAGRDAIVPYTSQAEAATQGGSEKR